ncbi:MAG TPA: acetyl-CoA carboxylase biotin carboxyl carrier protein [Candidatus Polarisedimenticolaceae bacterium]|nr:acetyl-CoA carboxylase biotin carboxyl carrier protein [Candidatus Polarisedimenticolaceae bacterium]
MDAKELRELIELISKSNFVTFELEREGFKLKLEKSGGVPPPAIVVAAPANAPSLPMPAPMGVAPQAVAQPPLPPSPAAPAVASGLVDVKSPIVGTFFRQPSPTASPFVEPGSRVKKGQVLCIIEAMKLMNEIEAEMDAEVVEIPVANGQPVEFGEVLFRLRPMAS